MESPEISQAERNRFIGAYSCRSGEFRTAAPNWAGYSLLASSIFLSATAATRSDQNNWIAELASESDVNEIRLFARSSFHPGGLQFLHPCWQVLHELCLPSATDAHFLPVHAGRSNSESFRHRNPKLQPPKIS